MEPCITAIIVHWDQPDACRTTVAAFLDIAEVESVIVVDNGSTPQNLERLRCTLPDRAELIEVGRNSGFGPAANRGWERWLARSETTEWSTLAPHDALPQPGTITKMLAAGNALDRPGLLSADVGDGEAPFVDHVFGPITTPASTTDGFERVDYPHGTLMLASRACLTSVGLFDERYFAYCEEADLGLRAIAAGFDVGLVRGARVVNPQVNSPSPAVDYLKERNTVLLVNDHFGTGKAAMRFGLMLWQFARGCISSTQRGEYWSSRGRLLAIRDVLRRRWGPPPDELFV